MNKRVLAGDPEDMRWKPGFVPGMEIEKPEPEPAIEPELVENDVANTAVSPDKLPDEPIEVPLDTENTQPEVPELPSDPPTE